MTDENTAAGPPAAAGAKPQPTKRKAPLIRREDVILFLLVANMIGLVGLGIRVYRGDRPTVVTVGVTQLSREYLAKLATTNVSPDEARVRTQMFLAVAQDAVKRAVTRKGVLVLPRECVLAGEFEDLTPEVAKAVTATMEAKVAATALPAIGQSSQIVASAPTTGAVNVLDALQSH
jgi:hypothetical protein